MLCLNNFIVVGITDDGLQNLVYEVLQAMGQKVRKVNLVSSKIIIGFQDENCLISNEDVCTLFHGIFLGETPSSALNKITSKSLKSFLGEYHYQGVSVLIDRKEEKIYAVGDPGASRAVFYFVLPENIRTNYRYGIIQTVAKSFGHST